MAVDLALSEAPQRNGRRATQSPQIDTGRAEFTQRDTPREFVARDGGASAGQGYMHVADSLNRFFPKLAGALAQRDIEQARRDNAKEIARIETQVRADRQGAREAIQTGDYSKFIPDDDMRRRQVIQDSFKSLVAQQMAYEDYDDKLRPAIDQTPLDGDPDQTVADFIAENTKGADPLFARDYSRVLVRASSKQVELFRDSRLELQQHDAERRGRDLVKAELESGSVPSTPDGLTTMRAKIIGALPMNPADAVGRADAIIDDALIKEAASGNTLALKLAQMPDPKRDGTSVLSRHPGLMEKTVAALVARKHAIRSVAASDNLDTMRDRLAKIEAGQPMQGDSIEGLWADVWTHRNKFGEGGDWTGIRDKVATALHKAGADAGAVALVAKGQMPTMSNRQWSDFAFNLATGKLDGALADQGLSPQAAKTRAIEAVARRGSGSKVKDAYSAILLGGADANQVMQAYTFEKAIDGATDRPMEGNHLSSDAARLFTLMSHAEHAGLDPMQVRGQFLEALNKADGRVDPDHYYENLQKDPGARPGTDNAATYGRAGAAFEAKKVWKSLDIPSLQVPGFFGDSMPSYEQLAPAVRDRLIHAVNNAAFLLSTQKASMDEITSLAGSLIKGEFGLEMDHNGNPAVTIDQTPPVAVGPKGEPLPGQKVTSAVLDRAHDALAEPGTQAVMTAIGGFGGLRQDALTRAGDGLAVRSFATGNEKDVLLLPGKKIMLPLHAVPAEMPPAFFETVSKDAKNDQIVLRIPDRPAAGAPSRIYLNDSLFMLYDKQRDAWTLRYADKGAPRMDLKKLASMNRASREKFEELRKTSESFRMKANLKAFSTREKARDAAIGSPAPGHDDPGPMAPEEAQGVLDATQKATDEMAARGMLSPQTHSDESIDNVTDPQPVTERTRRSILREHSNGGWLDDMTKPINQRYMHEVGDFIIDHEGHIPFVYDDKTKDHWKPGKSTGNPTIGIGFNMNRPDARELIKKVGGDYDSLMASKSVLSDAQQRRLLRITLKPTVAWLRKHFKGVDMANHRWLALTSLAFNSRWGEHGPTLIGPHLTHYVRTGQWEKAAEEIEFRSAGGVPASLKAGIMARRRDEANMFRGVFN